MAGGKLTGVRVEKVEDRVGLLGRKTVSDEMLCLGFPGGSVCIRRSAVIGAGDNYFRLKRQLMELAQVRELPWQEAE